MQGRIYPNLKTSNFPRLLRQESIYPNLKKRSVFLGKGTKVQTANHAADKTSTSRSAHFPLPGPAARALFRESLGHREPVFPSRRRASGEMMVSSPPPLGPGPWNTPSPLRRRATNCRGTARAGPHEASSLRERFVKPGHVPW